MKRLLMMAMCAGILLTSAGCSLVYKRGDEDDYEIGLFGFPEEMAEETDDLTSGLIPLYRRTR
jgi:hypothetical protein